MVDSLLPPSSTRLERDVEQVTARIDRAAAPFHTLWNAWECPLHLLPWLAWALGVDEWSNSWPENRKRQVVATALQVRRRAGTRGAVRTAVEALDIEGIEYSEWYQYGGEPHSYRISATLEERGMSQEEYEQLVRVINRAGRLSAWLDPVGFTLQARGRPSRAQVTLSGQHIELRPYRITSRQQCSAAHRAAAGRMVVATELRPYRTSRRLQHHSPSRSTALRSLISLTTRPFVTRLTTAATARRWWLTTRTVITATVYPTGAEI